MLTSIIILSIILAIISVIFLLKNTLLSRTISNKGWKYIIFTIFMLSALICAFGGSFNGFGLKDALDFNNSLPSDPFSQSQKIIIVNLPKQRASLVIDVIVGYLFFLAGCFINLNIKRELKKIAANPKGTWNLSKINDSNSKTKENN